MLTRREVLFFIAATPALVLASGKAASLTLSDLKGRLREPKTLSADFVQRRELKGIKRPLVSRGRVVLERGRGVLWDQASPFLQRMTVTPGRVRIELEGRKSAEEIPVTDPKAKAFAGLVEGVLAGDTAQLEAHFKVESVRALPGDRWAMALLPREAMLSRAFSRIEITGGSVVESLALASPAGEKTTIEFHNIKTDEPLEAACAARLGR